MIVETEIRSKILQRIEQMLRLEFPGDQSRQKIETHHDRLNFACPVCGDSTNDRYKKRGNLYWSSMKYHCYNCGYHSGTNALLERFDQSLDSEDRLHVMETQQNYAHEHTTISSDSWLQDLILKLAIPRALFMSEYHVVDVTRSQAALKYMQLRRIQLNRYKHFAYDEFRQELYILNCTPNGDIIGYQIRHLKPGVSNRYLSFNISKIYQRLFKGRDISIIVETILSKSDDSDILIVEDGIANIVDKLNTISMLFNITLINFSHTVYVCEGPIDAVFIQNCVALCGANKLRDYFDDLDDICYIFDNDTTGQKHSFEKLKKNKRIFLWGKFIKENKLKKLKDVNDVYMKTNIQTNFITDEYISNNELDAIYV